MDKQFEELKELLEDKKNIDLVQKAYEFSKKFFENEKRISGENYFNHPYRVAKTCAENKMDNDSIIVSLLHGICLIDKSKEKEIKEKFGESIFNLQNEINKINLINKSIVSLDFAEELRKMILSSSKDIRVIFIKLADKLDNMRTLGSLDKKQQKEIAKLTLEIYAPIANRLGLGKIKSELEDLSLKHLDPDAFYKIKEFLPQKKKEREIIIDNTKKKLISLIEKEKIKYQMLGRPKNIYSIYKKSSTKKLEEINDLLAFRIIVENIKDCYEVLRLIHTTYKPILNRLKDYIASPKENNYRSIHTTVFDENHNVLEIQIRTGDMDKQAEEGIAAHFIYKGFEGNEKYDKKMSWIKEIINNDNNIETDIVDIVKFEFFSEKIYCITPAGKVINLPKNATAIDFAYAIHSNIGDKSIGVRINGKYKTLRSELSNGDLVEIITQKNHMPSREWLKFAKTHKARSKIRKALNEVSQIPHPKYSKSINKIEEKINSKLIYVNKMQDYNIKFAKCCNPMPGDEIIGININGFTINIHNKNCEKLKKQNIRKDRILKSHWQENTKGEIELKISCSERKGLMVDLLNTISRLTNKINSANAKIIDKEKVSLSFKIEVENLEHINNILNAIKKIKSVKKIMITKC